MTSKSRSAGRFPAIIMWILHLLPWVLVVAELICIGVYAAKAGAPRKISQNPPAVLASALPASSSEAEETSGFFTSAEFPEGRLFVTAARGAYQDGAMQLLVPKLGADGIPVSKTSGDATLRNGIGLSDFSQMPAENLGNVIILGWGGFAESTKEVEASSDATSGASSGTSGDASSDASSGAASVANSAATSSDAEIQPAPFTPRDGSFKGLETLVAGDTAALTHDGTRYSYSYKDTKTFAEDDWAPLYVQGFNCLSLVSPVGNGQSVVVRFELTDAEAL